MSEARFEAQPNVGNHFAWMRTEMALQRTLLAAARTAVSLIGFGFTVAQFFEKLFGETPAGRHVGPETPRNLGMVLIAAGVVSLTVFTWQYYAASSYLRTEFPTIAGQRLRTSAYLVAFVVIAIGIAAFVSVFARF